MIDVSNFYDVLLENNIDFFTGVPDSLLKSFCAYIKDNVSNKKNIIAANEGNAIALAAGNYLSTGKVGLVYMQNSGIGNAINPLASLTDLLVYNIPILLLIGWRGEPGKKDEPQHKKQGLITIDLLETLGIKYKVISEESTNDHIKYILKEVCDYMKATKEVFAIVVKKGSFNNYKLKNITENSYVMSRESAIDIVLNNIKEDSIIVSTTGMASREVFEIRERKKEGHEKDFLTVGSMGHASQIALGIAINKIDRDVYCIDGDGAMLMHLGGMAIIGDKGTKNFKHIVINNGAHDSVGGQDTVGFNIDILSIAKACGYRSLYSCKTEEELIKCINEVKLGEGPILLEIKVKKGARKDLGRPTNTPIENKQSFMEYLR